MPQWTRPFCFAPPTIPFTNVTIYGHKTDSEPSLDGRCCRGPNLTRKISSSGGFMLMMIMMMIPDSPIHGWDLGLGLLT